jgi:addiction module HigA family antidote
MRLHNTFNIEETVMGQLRKPVHPGKVFFEDVLIPLGITVTDAARMMGITRKALSEFVNEKTSCSPLMALRMAQVTHTSAESWIAMQTKLELWKAYRNMPGPLRKFPKMCPKSTIRHESP